MARITIKSGEFKNRSYELQKDVLSVGRSSDNIIQVIDKKISRKHAEFVLKQDKYWIVDLKSKNGTYVNGMKVLEQILNDGDVITVGETYLIFNDEPTKSKDISGKVKLVEDGEWGKMKKTMKVGSSPSFLEIDVKKSEPEELKSAHEKLTILYRASEAISAILDIDKLLDKIMDLVYEVAKPERGFILLKEEETNDLVVRVMRLEENKMPDGNVTISSTIINRCLTNKVAMLISDVMEDSQLSASASVVLQNIRSAISVPLISSDRILGVVYVDSSSIRRTFNQEILEVVIGICNQASLAIDNAIMNKKLLEQNLSAKEMDIARDIQINFLPKIPPATKNFDISVMSVPAKKVGGDYYDFIPLSEDKLGIMIADVAGKGIPAALLVSIVRSAFRMEAQRAITNVEELMYITNNAVCRDTVNNMFITVFYLVLNVNSGEIIYSNAGHCYPLLIKKEGEVEKLKVGGSIFGMFENSTYKSEKIILENDDILILYTDGVTDSKNEKDESYGTKRLINKIQENIYLKAEEIKKKVYEDVRSFAKTGELFDDFTLMVIKKKKESEQ